MKTRKITKQKVGKVLGWLTDKEIGGGKFKIMVASFMEDTKPIIRTKTTGIKVSEYSNGKKKLCEKMLAIYLTSIDTELDERLRAFGKGSGGFDAKRASITDYLNHYMSVRERRLDTAVNSLSKAHFLRGWSYVASLQKYLTNTLHRPHMPLYEFSREHLLGYLDSLYSVNTRGTINTANTVRHYYDYFLPCFRYAFDNYFIQNDITRGIVKPQSVAREIPHLTKDEIVKFLEHTNDPKCLLGGALQTLVLTGARRSELLALRFCDIDHEQRLIHLRRKVLTEQGGKLFFYDKMKTMQSNRTLPLSHLVELIIQRQKSLTADTDPYSLIFRKPNGKPIRPDELTKGIKAICRACGITEINLHATRHSFANLARQSGVAEEVRSALLGHKSKTMTGHYSNKVEDHEKIQAIDLIVKKLELPKPTFILRAEKSVANA